MNLALKSLALALALASPASAAKRARPDPFAQTEKTGARIAQTVSAVVAAAHALEKSKYSPPHANTFFALQQGGTWYVVFGWLEPTGEKFTPALVVAGPEKDLSKMAQVPVEKAPKDLARFARAVDRSRAAAARATGSGTVNPVLLVSPRELDVYVLQGPGRDAVLLGGDFLFRYDRTGKKLLSEVRYHKAVIEVPLDDPKRPGSHTQGSFHTHVIDEEPTPTDVAEAILHPAVTPMFVQGRSGKAYRVDEAGLIHLEPKLAAQSATPVAQMKGLDVPAAPAADGGAK